MIAVLARNDHQFNAFVDAKADSGIDTSKYIRASVGDIQNRNDISDYELLEGAQYAISFEDDFRACKAAMDRFNMEVSTRKTTQH